MLSVTGHRNSWNHCLSPVMNGRAWIFSAYAPSSLILFATLLSDVDKIRLNFLRNRRTFSYNICKYETIVFGMRAKSLSQVTAMDAQTCPVSEASLFWLLLPKCAHITLFMDRLCLCYSFRITIHQSALHLAWKKVDHRQVRNFIQDQTTHVGPRSKMNDITFQS